jgi:large subunit ribosomal protein L9
MKVLLKEDVDNIGYAGEVHKVADGYGRNYLIPKGLAVLATGSVMKQADVWRKKAEARREELRAEYEMLSQKINETTLTYSARAGETGKLYGSITTSQITDDLNEVLGTEIDRHKVGVEPLRQLGKHQVVVRLSGDFQPHVTVLIEPEEGSPAQLVLEESAEEEEMEVIEDVESLEEEVVEEIEDILEEELDFLE